MGKVRLLPLWRSRAWTSRVWHGHLRRRIKRTGPMLAAGAGPGAAAGDAKARLATESCLQGPYSRPKCFPAPKFRAEGRAWSSHADVGSAAA